MSELLSARPHIVIKELGLQTAMDVEEIIKLGEALSKLPERQLNLFIELDSPKALILLGRALQYAPFIGKIEDLQEEIKRLEEKINKLKMKESELKQKLGAQGVPLLELEKY